MNNYYSSGRRSSGWDSKTWQGFETEAQKERQRPLRSCRAFEIVTRGARWYNLSVAKWHSLVESGTFARVNPKHAIICRKLL
jgi:hypothetical protein